MEEHYLKTMLRNRQKKKLSKVVTQDPREASCYSVDLRNHPKVLKQ